MRITGTGHAGLRVETAGGSVLCDPWRNPAFFGSWFPFPDNTGLDWDALGRCDYLYVSHLHRDHFDAELLRDHVQKDATVLLPVFPSSELEDALREVGFTRFRPLPTGEVVDLDGLQVLMTALDGPGDGPIGDSALALADDTARVFDQNDAHPLDMSALAAFGPYDAHFSQFSGAIWWPMVYDLPPAAKREFARRKRAGQEQRALRFLRQVGARHAFPTAGPPCFLDDELFAWNAEGFGDVEGQSIFTDQWQFLARLRAAAADPGPEGLPGMQGHLLLPGSVAVVEDGRAAVTHPMSEEEVRRIFEDKESYLREFAERQRPVLAREKASRAQPQPDLAEQLKDWFEPLMARAVRISGGIGACVRLDAGDTSVVLDFPRGQVRPYAGEQVRYRISTSADLIATNVATREVDWSNSLFLSMRFTASRIGQYNEYLYVFFKCLSQERIDYVEQWYARGADDGEDLELDGWVVQRHCPHLAADLSVFGSVEGSTLTCALHGWRFDLNSGRCLTSDAASIRARQAEPVA